MVGPVRARPGEACLLVMVVMVAFAVPAYA